MWVRWVWVWVWVGGWVGDLTDAPRRGSSGGGALGPAGRRHGLGEGGWRLPRGGGGLLLLVSPAWLVWVGRVVVCGRKEGSKEAWAANTHARGWTGVEEEGRKKGHDLPAAHLSGGVEGQEEEVSVWCVWEWVLWREWVGSWRGPCALAGTSNRRPAHHASTLLPSSFLPRTPTPFPPTHRQGCKPPRAQAQAPSLLGPD